MPQVFVLLDKYLADRYCPGEQLDSFIQGLVPLIEKRFGIEGKKDVAVTIVGTVRTINEANIQVEIRYTAGEDEYGTGRPFDPPLKVQEELIGDIKISFEEYRRRNFSSPPLSMSVWCKPFYNSVFKTL